MSQYDDDNDLDEVMGVLNTASNLYETATSVTYNNQKLKSAENIKNATLLASIENQKNKLDYETKNTLITQEIKDSQANITDITNKLAAYDTHVQDWYNLKDKDKGPFGKQILDDIGINYGENLQYTVQIADDATQQLENNENMLDLTRKIENDLMSKYNNVLSLQEDYLKVRDDGIYKGIREFSEQQTYIDENPLRFGNILETDFGQASKKLGGTGTSTAGREKALHLSSTSVNNQIDLLGSAGKGELVKELEGTLMGQRYDTWTNFDMRIAVNDLKEYQKVIDGTADATVTQEINAKYPELAILQKHGITPHSSDDWEKGALSKAFLSEKKVTSTGEEYGYIPKITQDRLKIAGYNYKTGRPFSAEDRDEVEFNINHGFELLSQDTRRVRFKDKSGGTDTAPTSKWLQETVDIDGIEKLAGAKDLWSDPDAATELRNKLEIALVNMFDVSTKDTFGFDPSEKQAKLRKEWGFDSGNVMTHPQIRYQVIKAMHERYLGLDESTIIDPVTQVESKHISPRTKTRGGRLNEQYAIDGMYHEDDLRWLKDKDDYGDTAKDDVFYDILYLWNQVNDAYPLISQQK